MHDRRSFGDHLILDKLSDAATRRSLSLIAPLSEGSNQTFFSPHFSMAAANLFCKRRFDMSVIIGEVRRDKNVRIDSRWISGLGGDRVRHSDP